MAKPDPWRNIPLSDYEGHMSAPAVGQLCALSELFANVLLRVRPESLAVLGIAGGNGLEHVDPQVTRRVVGVDINPSYLETLRQRHAARLNLELHCADLCEELLSLEPVQLVHAALIFEHAGTVRCLDNALALVRPGGVLSVVLQLPGAAPGVAPTPFASIQVLSETFTLIDPSSFISAVEASGLPLQAASTHPLSGGKGFWLGLFSKNPLDLY